MYSHTHDPVEELWECIIKVTNKGWMNRDLFTSVIAISNWLWTRLSSAPTQRLGNHSCFMMNKRNGVNNSSCTVMCEKLQRTQHFKLFNTENFGFRWKACELCFGLWRGYIGAGVYEGHHQRDWVTNMYRFLYRPEWKIWEVMHLAVHLDWLKRWRRNNLTAKSQH